MTQPTSTDAQTRAEILRWQGRYRRIAVPLVALAAIALKWFGVVSAESVLVPRLGHGGALLAALAGIALYLAFHQGLQVILRRRGEATAWMPIAVSVSDVIAIIGTVALVSPPEHYERALIISIFTVQLTQIFFGWTATIANLAFVSIGYTILVAYAAAETGRISLGEELWTLALYNIGALIYVALQGAVTRRMAHLERLFAKASEGDFSAQWEEAPDNMPDPIAMIGRAYNRMRGHLETIVLTDPLSGCFNRRGLNQLAEREVSRALRARRPISVLSIDVDHFKQINDVFGHLIGDEVLREVGKLLRDTAREPDVVARVGGEEFAILAPDTGSEGSMILAERLLDAFRGHAFKSLPAGHRVTASVGVSSAPTDDENIARTLFAHADEALYIAKRNGRDRAAEWADGMRAFDGTVGARGRLSTPGMVRAQG